MSIAIQLAACAVVSGTLSGILVSMVMASKIRKLREEQKRKSVRVEPSITTSPGASASVREGTERALRSTRSSHSHRSASTDHGFTAGVAYGMSGSDSSSCSSSSSSSGSFSSCD